jgi:myo-inositol-1(or 4)-monophosphatase
MTPPVDSTLAVDWLGLCRRAADGARGALARNPLPADRAATAGRGMGGDMSLVIDREVEDAVFHELEALGLPLTAVSEERGEIQISGGGPVHVVVDPIDGSRNAKRGLPAYALSIAIASGASMADVQLGYVHDLGTGEDWWAERNQGAFCDGVPVEVSQSGDLEMVGLETVHPALVAQHAEALAATGAARLRGVGSIALSLCYVAAGRLDALVSLGATRSVDSAAGQLIVTEAGGAVSFPEAAAGGDLAGTSLSLDMRSRVVAAAGPDLVERLIDIGRTA